MKSIHKITMFICAIIFCGTVNVSGQDKNFDNPEQAVEQAKKDLIAILEEGKDFKFDISIEELRNAQAASRMEYRQLSFDALLNSDSIGAISELRSELLYYVVPLVTNNKVVTNVQIAEAGQRWMISGLLNKNHTQALNKIPADIRNRNMGNISIYEVPNIHAVLYVVQRDQVEEVFTDYKERYNLQRPAEISELYPMLRDDARKFQQEWGNQLNDQKLVK